MIRELTEADFPTAAALAAAAFREDPGFAHILPGDALRRHRLPSLFEAILRVDATGGGRVSGAFEDGALVGVSSLMPAGVKNPGIRSWFKRLPGLSWLALEPAALLRALSLIHAIEARRMNSSAYLHLLAAHPATRGRGVGAALLNAAIKTSGGSLYLEIFSRENIAWYEQRGFRFLMEVNSPVRPTFWTLRHGAGSKDLR